MISREEVVKIAKLARLELTDEETIKMQKDMSAILDYFNLLKNAPKAELKIENADLLATRKDEVLLHEAGMAQSLISAAPDKKDDYIKVKTIL